MKRTDATIAQDAGVKKAATELFWASDDFRRAYTEWMFAPERESGTKLEALIEAERHIDEAKRALSDAQSRVDGRRLFDVRND